MPIKISKKSKRTKKGKGKVSQSQQVIVNIQKGKRKASSQPVSRPSQAPIIIQQPQQDITQLENLFRQYSTSRPVAEPKPVTMGMETQTETPIMVKKEPAITFSQEQQQRVREKLAEMEREKPIPVERSKSAPPRERPATIPFPVRGNAPKPTPEKVLNPNSGKMVSPAYFKKLVKEGKIKPE
jgi:hypothetical protein